MTRGVLARGALKLGGLGFGGAPIGNLGEALSDEAAEAAAVTAWSNGLRYFDTAPHYGLGLSERRLAHALAVQSRSSYVLSSKVGRLLQPNPHPTGSDAPNGFAVRDDLIRVRDYTRDGVLRSIDASLQRLRTDRLDIAYVHDAEDHLDVAIQEAIPTLVDLRDSGVVTAVGIGMNEVNAAARLVRAGDLDVVMLAGRWTLLDRSGLPLLDLCAERGIDVIAAAPFNSGILATAWPADGARFGYRPAAANLVRSAQRMAHVCSRVGTSLPAAALQFPYRHPSVVCVVAGLATPSQVEQAVEHLDERVPDELWEELDVALLDARAALDMPNG